MKLSDAGVALWACCSKLYRLRSGCSPDQLHLDACLGGVREVVEVKDVRGLPWTWTTLNQLAGRLNLLSIERNARGTSPTSSLGSAARSRSPTRPNFVLLLCLESRWLSCRRPQCMDPLQRQAQRAGGTTGKLCQPMYSFSTVSATSSLPQSLRQFDLDDTRNVTKGHSDLHYTVHHSPSHSFPGPSRLSRSSRLLLMDVL